MVTPRITFCYRSVVVTENLITKGVLSPSLTRDLDNLIVLADKESPLMNLGKHSRNVAIYARRMFEHLPAYERRNWGDVTPEEIFVAGKYHDIGKAFLAKYRRGMLDKGRFDEHDRFNVQEHVTFGYALLHILEEENNLEDRQFYERTYDLLGNAVMYHHERMDGSGYLGIRGEAIPRIGSFIAVADCFCAGIERRCYAEAKAYTDVLRELKVMPLNQLYVNALEMALASDCFCNH